jgi:iron complex transport system permease protein
VGRLLWGLSLLVVLTFAVSLFVGRYPRPPLMPPHYLFDDELARRLVLNLRLPRIIGACIVGACIVGASLAGAGLVLQMIFRNPLVSPGFLGVSQGAGFGAALAIIFLGAASLWVEGLAVVFAFAGLAASYWLAQRIRFGDWALRLVLAGIAVSAFFSAGLGVLNYVADPLQALPNIVFWLLGGLWGATWPELLRVLPITVVSLTVLMLMRWRLNLLSLRDESAFSLGASLARERLLIMTAAVAATAATVALAGIVGWVGLIIPHLARRIVGVNAKYAMPAAMLLGAVFVILCDDIARTMLAGDVPLGILTSLLGALFFVVLLTSQSITLRRS